MRAQGGGGGGGMEGSRESGSIDLPRAGRSTPSIPRKAENDPDFQQFYRALALHHMFSTDRENSGVCVK